MSIGTSKKAPCTCDFDKANNAIVFVEVGLIGPEVGKMDNLFCTDYTVERNSRVVAQVDFRVAAIMINVILFAVNRDGVKQVIVTQKQIAEGSRADTGRVG